LFGDKQKLNTGDSLKYAQTVLEKKKFHTCEIYVKYDEVL